MFFKSLKKFNAVEQVAIKVESEFVAKTFVADAAKQGGS